MKIYIANDARPQQGGGFSFINYLTKGLGDAATSNYDEATHFFIPSASMIKPERAEQAKADGKKVVLRVDNALKHSRNDGKGMARMHRMASIADLVVYQCKWAKEFLDDFLGNPHSAIVYNGIDLDIFKPEGGKMVDNPNGSTYLYASASKGENKRWDWAWYDYQKRQKESADNLLLIAGRVSTAVMQNNFDFFNQERYTYLGMMTTPEQMASVYRSANYFYAVAENDCYSNALLEALACGLEPVEISQTGGTPELLRNWWRGDRLEFNSIWRMVDDYKEVMGDI